MQPENLHNRLQHKYHENIIKRFILFFFQESFARAKNWVKELQRQASPNIVIALSGNKADLANKRAVDFQVRKKQQKKQPVLKQTVWWDFFFLIMIIIK